MTNPEELERRLYGPPPAFWAAIWAIVAVLAVGAYFGARPAWRGLKEWRATRFLAAARLAHDHGQLPLALDEARSAFQLAPDNAEVLRLTADLLRQSGSEECLPVLQRLVVLQDASDTDRTALAEASVIFERPDLAEAWLTNLPPGAPRSPRIDRIAAHLALEGGRPADALRYARDTVAAEPHNPTNAVLLGSVLARSPAEADRKEARALFWSLVRTNSPFRLDALRRLVVTELGERRDREEAAEVLAALNPRKLAEDILLQETRMILDPSAADLTVSNLVAAIPRDDEAHLTLVVDVLVRHGRYPEVLQITVGGRSLLNERLFYARFDALTAVGETEAAYRHLLLPGAPVHPFDLQLARFRAAEAVRDPTRRDSHLRALLDLAEENPARQRRVARLAEEAGALEIAADAWTRLGTHPVETRESLVNLQRIADRRSDTWTARDFARRADRLGPPDPDLKRQLAYYDLLLGEDLDRALRTAESLLAARTNDFEARATVALGHLRLGNPAGARDVLDGSPLDAGSTTYGALAVVVASLGENGLDENARQFAGRIPLSRLRPEERSLIRKWVLPVLADPGAAIP